MIDFSECSKSSKENEDVIFNVYNFEEEDHSQGDLAKCVVSLNIGTKSLGMHISKEL